jgi:hypothetical protein
VILTFNQGRWNEQTSHGSISEMDNLKTNGHDKTIGEDTNDDRNLLEMRILLIRLVKFALTSMIQN